MFKNQWIILLLTGLFLLLIQYVFVVVLATSELRKFADSYFKLIPPFVKQFIGFTGIGLSDSQFIAFGYYHPAVLLLTTIVPIMLAGRYVSSELEGRSVELMILRLYPRYRLLTTPIFFTIIAIVFLFIMMSIGTWAALYFWDLQDAFTVKLSFEIAGTGVLFFTTITLFTFMITTFNQERSRATSWSTGFILFFFVLDALIRLWPQIDFLKPYSLFQYYNSMSIANGQFDFMLSILILTGLSVLFSVITFQRLYSLSIAI